MPSPSVSSILAPRPSDMVKGEQPVKGARSADARILKKREADRKCQRKIRERQKAKVASLEQTVEELKHRDPSGQVEALLRKLAERTNQIEALDRKVKAIQAVLLDNGADSDSLTTQPVCPSPDPGDSSRLVVDSPRRGGGKLAGVSRIPSMPAPESETEQELPEVSMGLDVPISTQDLDAFSAASPFAHFGGLCTGRPPSLPEDEVNELGLVKTDPIVPVSQHPCECSRPSNAIGAPANIWRFANETLSERFQWPSHFEQLEDLTADDTPVRAVVEGWEAVERRGPLHPSWQILKQIDQVIFWKCNPRERLAVLHVMHMLFESHSHPDKIDSLPEYYLKRPSESTMHSYGINFFTWPGLRERFVRQQHRYCSNEFWKYLTQNCRIVWPYEFRDCYTRNVETGSYTISSLFRERLSDIRSWTVCSDMIYRWPEIGADIPVFDSIPASIIPEFPKAFLRQSPTQRVDTAKRLLPVESISETSRVKTHHDPGGTPDFVSVATFSHAFDSPIIENWSWNTELPVQGDFINDTPATELPNLDHFAGPFT